MRALGAIAVLLASTAALTAMSGLPSPQLNSQSSGAEGTLGGRRFSQSVEVSNDGFFPEHLAGLDTGAAGVRIEKADYPQTIEPGAHATIEVSYRVVDCALVGKDEAAPIRVRARRIWGRSTRTLDGGTAGLAWDACHSGPR